MVRPKRKNQYPDLQDTIKEVARKQMAQDGAAALSLRAIAREIGITAPAIYNYFSRRDDLVTALIVDAYKSLAASLAEAQEQKEGLFASRITAAANAYRTWALAHPSEYSLIFGTPIPGYDAPMEITNPAAASSMLELIKILDAAWQNREINLEEPSSELLEFLQPWTKKLNYTGPPEIIHLALASWAQLHGLVSLELFGHLTSVPGCSNADVLFDAEIQAVVARMGIE